MPNTLTAYRGGDNGNVGDPKPLWRLMESMKISLISLFNQSDLLSFIMH